MGGLPRAEGVRMSAGGTVGGCRGHRTAGRLPGWGRGDSPWVGGRAGGPGSVRGLPGGHCASRSPPQGAAPRAPRVRAGGRGPWGKGLRAGGAARRDLRLPFCRRYV